MICQNCNKEYKKGETLSALNPKQCINCNNQVKGDEDKMTQFKEFKIRGEFIAALPEAERWFELIADPEYEKKEGYKDKIVMQVKLSDDTIGLFYPNTTSANVMANLNKTTDMTKWKNKKYYFGYVHKRNIAGVMKEVVFITDFYPPKEKP